jgi:hypothetical protein
MTIFVICDVHQYWYSRGTMVKEMSGAHSTNRKCGNQTAGTTWGDGSVGGRVVLGI